MFDQSLAGFVSSWLRAPEGDRFAAWQRDSNGPVNVASWRLGVDVPLQAYLKRSSNALRALVGAADLVSRSTVVRGSKSAHVFLASLGETLTRIGF